MSTKKKASTSELKENEFEKILATRTSSNGSQEYLVKLRTKSYRESKWFSGDILQSNPQAASMLTRFMKNQREYPTEPPYYDEQYDVIDRIITKKDKKYLVKWMGLGYDQITWEKEEIIKTFPDSLNDFEARKVQRFPLKSGNIHNQPTINFEKLISYNIGDTKLESYQVSTMNLLLYNFSKMQSTEIVDRYNTQLILPCAAFFQYLVQNNLTSAKPNPPKRGRKPRNYQEQFTGEELGPLLIVAPLPSTAEWYNTFREIKECTTLHYTGTKETRQMALENDFYLSDDRLKFHVLITTPEILSNDNDILSEIQWRIAIFDEANRLKNPQSRLSKILQRFVIGVQISLMQSQPSIFCLQKLTSLLLRAKTYFDEDTIDAIKDVQSRIQPKLSKRKNQASILFDDDNDTYTTYYIDCPLSLTQKKVLRSVIQDQIKYVQKKNFMPLCQRILRICSHPFLLFSQEYMMNGVDLVLSSTKLGILEHLLVKSNSDEAKVLVTSEFSMMLDMVQDICNENRIYTERIVTQSKDVLIPNANVYLYNPKLCELAGTIFETINTIIIIDGDYKKIQQRIISDKPPNLRKVYKLICRDCSETKLNSICVLNQSSESPNIEQCESICKLSTLAAFSDKQIPDPKALIDKATVVANSFNPNELLEKEFEKCDFWGSLFGEESTTAYVNTVDDITENEEHHWTKRERDQLLRGLRRFGLDRWKDLRIQTGLNVNTQNLIHASRALLREMIRIIGSNSGHGISREFIKQNSELDDDEVADKTFINNTVFSDYEFAIAIQNNANSYLREMEMLHYLGECIKDTSDIFEISLPHPTGKLPSWWTDDHDNYLAYATFKYGLGSYEQFVEDKNQEIIKIFGPSNDQIQYSLLTERALKLAEAIKRKQGVTQLGLVNNNNNEITINKKETIEVTETTAAPTRRTTFQSPNDENYSSTDSRKRDEGRDIYQFLLRYGVPEDPEGNPDYKAFGEQCGLINDTTNSKSVEQVQILVEDYLAKCNIPPEEGGIPTKTANRVKERCTVMKQLREMLRDEKLAFAIFKHVPHWRYLPDKWTPELEYDYFKHVAEIGLVNDQYHTILRSDQYQGVFKDNEPPSFILKDTNVMKRINNLYQSMTEGKNDGSLEALINASTNKVRTKPKTKTAAPQDDSTKGSSKPKKDNKVPFGFVVQTNHGLFPADRAIFKGTSVKYPVNIGKGRFVENIGKIIPEREDFHNDRYIYPIGYKVKNVLPSASQPGVTTTWVNEITVYQNINGKKVILDDPASHLEEELNDLSYHLYFRSWMESEPLKKYEAETANGVWSLICKDISSINNGKKYTISGMDAFLLTNRTMIYVVQHMKGAKKCNLYVAKEVELPKDMQRLKEWTMSQGSNFVFTPNSDNEIIPEDQMVDQEVISHYRAKPGPKAGFAKKNKYGRTEPKPKGRPQSQPKAKRKPKEQAPIEEETEYEYEYEEETVIEYEEDEPEK